MPRSSSPRGIGVGLSGSDVIRADGHDDTRVRVYAEHRRALSKLHVRNDALHRELAHLEAEARRDAKERRTRLRTAGAFAWLRRRRVRLLRVFRARACLRWSR